MKPVPTPPARSASSSASSDKSTESSDTSSDLTSEEPEETNKRTRKELEYISSSEEAAEAAKEMSNKKQKTTVARSASSVTASTQSQPTPRKDEEPKKQEEKKKKKGQEDVPELPELPKMTQAVMDMYTVKKRERVYFNKLIWDTEKKMGQCRALKEWLVQKYYKSLLLALPELPVSDVLGWNKQGVHNLFLDIHGNPSIDFLRQGLRDPWRPAHSESPGQDPQ